MPAKPIPDGYHSLTPYLIVADAAKAIDFYKRAFGATELLRLADPSGRVAHAEIRVGDSVLMLADENEQWGAKGPRTIGGSPMSLLLYVENVDAAAVKALAAGATAKRPVKDQFYGDRAGTFEDPFGHTWTIASHVEDVAAEEIMRRFQASMQTA